MRARKAVRLLWRVATRLYLPDGLRMKVPPSAYATLATRCVGRLSTFSRGGSQRLGIKVPGKLLVVIGGSQGAEALNQWVTDHFQTLAEDGVSLYCVTGLGRQDREVLQHVNRHGQTICATLVPFSDCMGDVISAADLVVSRAGAGSIAEIVRCRAPSILIPYPYATGNHQLANARAHEQHGAAVVVAQDDLGSLLDEVRALMFNDWLLSKFKSNMERMERFDSSSKITEDLLKLLTRMDTGGLVV